MANQAVYGIVKNRRQVEQIIQSCVDAGIPQINISILAQQGEEFTEFQNVQMSTETTTRNWRNEERITDFPPGTTPEERYRSTNGKNELNKPRTDLSKSKGQTPGNLGTEKHTKAPEGAATGATTGGLIGGTLGLLAGIGALAIPGFGPFIAAGPLMAALSGLGAGGALGGIIGALIGSGIPEYEAKRYEDKLNKGGILVSVRANSDELAKKVKEIFERNGAEDVTISSEAAGSRGKNTQR